MNCINFVSVLLVWHPITTGSFTVIMGLIRSHLFCFNASAYYSWDSV